MILLTGRPLLENISKLKIYFNPNKQPPPSDEIINETLDNLPVYNINPEHNHIYIQTIYEYIWREER